MIRYTIVTYMINACIFDLDGTLTNTLHTLAYFVNTETAKYGLPPAPVEAFKYFAGNGARTLIQRTLAYHSIHDTQLEDRILKNYNAAYDANFLHLCTVYPGVADMVMELYKKKIKLAVLSNKPQPTTEKVVEAFFGTSMFSAVFGQREGVPIKPNPAGVFEILQQFRCEPSECLYIGDTAVDMETGNAAGLTTVGVLWGFRERKELEESHAAYIIEKPEDILTLL